MSHGDGLTTTGLIERIKRVAPSVRQDLAFVGARAKYIWPGAKHTAWGGYSYELPKEEQIRSAFWAHLHDREALACELEWGLFETDGHAARAGREVDIAGFAVAGDAAPPVLLLEFKRAWNLTRRNWSNWNNKFTEMRLGIEVDVEKLRGVRETIGSCAAAPLLAGVVVVGFADDVAELARLAESILPHDPALSRHNLWSDEEVLCQAELEKGQVRAIYSRADLCVLTGGCTTR